MDKIEELIFPFFNGEFDDSDLWKNLRGNYKKIPKNKGIYVIVDNSEIDPVKKIAYIGQAGGKKSNKTLRERVRLFIKESKSHSGGKDVLGLTNIENLLVYWKILDKDPLQLESELLRNFIVKYGDLPYANREYKKYSSPKNN